MAEITLVLLITLSVIVAGCTFAQMPHETSLKVVDQNGKPVTNALVTIHDPTSGLLQNYTDENGQVTFLISESINYVITVSDSHQQTNQYILQPMNESYILTFEVIPTPTPTPKPGSPEDIQNKVATADTYINAGVNALNNGVQVALKFI